MSRNQLPPSILRRRLKLRQSLHSFQCTFQTRIRLTIDCALPMAEVNKQPVGWPGTVPDKAACFPIAKACKPVGDEDEWEYEYSTTETEVHLRFGSRSKLTDSLLTIPNRHTT